jgi:hypothetical protein
MKTVAEYLSRIKTYNKFASEDDFFSDRFLYQVLRSKAISLIKRELNQRKLLISDNIYQFYERLQLQSTNYTEFGLSEKVMKSVIELPSVEESIYGYMIQGVFSTANNEEIFPTSVREYLNGKKLRVQDKSKLYYIIKNRHLYVFNPEIVEVNIYAYFPEPINPDPCASFYEYPFKFPGYLEDSLFELINQSLLNYHRLPTEPYGNNEDNQP